MPPTVRNATTRNHSTHQRSRRAAAAASDDVIHGPYNSNRDSSYVELMLVADQSVFAVHKTVNKVHDYCKALANIVNAVRTNGLITIKTNICEIDDGANI